MEACEFDRAVVGAIGACITTSMHAGSGTGPPPVRIFGRDYARLMEAPRFVKMPHV